MSPLCSRKLTDCMRSGAGGSNGGRYSLVGTGRLICQLVDEKRGVIDGSIVSIKISEHLHTDGVSPGVCIRPGVVAHSSHVVVVIMFTVEVELIVNVDRDTGTEAETSSVLLWVSAIAVAVVTLTWVEVTKVVSVKISVSDDVFTVVSVETQVVLAVMDNVMVGRGKFVGLPDNAVKLLMGDGKMPERETGAISALLIAPYV